MVHGGTAWLSLALASETGRRDQDAITDACFAAIDLLAGGIDGARWLAAASFDTIMYGVVLRDGPAEPPSFRIRRRELEIDTIVDARTLPADPSWWFLQQAQRVLETVAARYDLSEPSLRELDHDPDLPLPPVDQNAIADIGADLDALEDDEILVAIPYQLPGEDEQTLFDRRLRIDAVLTEVLRAPPRASSATGNAYVFTFAVPDRRGRWRR